MWLSNVRIGGRLQVERQEPKRGKSSGKRRDGVEMPLIGSQHHTRAGRNRYVGAISHGTAQTASGPPEVTGPERGTGAAQGKMTRDAF